MPYTRDVRAMHPKAQGPTGEVLRRTAAAGYLLLITETRRDNATQAAYWSRGRQPLAEVSKLYRAAGLIPPTAAENRSTITNAATAVDSWHFYGLAFDFVPMVAGTTKALDWDYTPGDPADHWDEIVSIARDVGFLWGGLWTGRKDRPHLEWHPGRTLDEARAWAKSPAGKVPGAWLPL